MDSTANTDGTGPAATRPPLAWILASLALGMLLPALGTSIANVALPTLAVAFNASFQQVQWVVLAYLLATTTLIVSVGRLGDLLGRRRLLMAGMALFTAASALCGLAPQLAWLVAARAAQGLGAAVMMALTMAFVGEAVPKSKTGSAMGLLGTMSAIGTALGPTLGGVLIAGFGWRAIFFANVPLGLLALWLARRYLPADRPGPKAVARFDTLGTLLLALTLGAYALAMTLGRGHFGALNAALLLGAALGVGLFVASQARVPSPLIQLARFRDPGLSTSLAMNALVSTVMMATLVVGPFYLARGLGLDTALVGIVLSAGPVVTALSGVPAGRLVDRLGPQRVSLGALVGMVAGCLALCIAPTLLSGSPVTGLRIASYILPIVILTVHYAMFQAANNTAVMAEVPADQRGALSGLLNLFRNLGLITGASAMGAVFAFAAGTSGFATAPPAAITTGMRATFAVAAGLLGLALAIGLGGRAMLRRAPA